MTSATKTRKRRKAKSEPLTRSELMSRVRGKDTGPEMAVRRALWAAGLRYRLHDGRLPGRPDIVFPSKRIIVLIHGCFWHGHEGCPRHRIPKSRVEWWTAKITRNKERDGVVRAALVASGWTVMILWECETEISTKVNDLVTAIKSAPVGA